MDEPYADSPPEDDDRVVEPSTDVQWLAPGIVLVALGGEHDLVTAGELELQFEQALLQGAARLIVDLTATEFVELEHDPRDLRREGAGGSSRLSIYPRSRRHDASGRKRPQAERCLPDAEPR